MTARAGALRVTSSLGIVVIGRNEGELLRRALESIPVGLRGTTVYVDSGSSDGSLNLARQLGADSIALDPSQPFSPGRGRREGASRLLERHPQVEFLQFLDGDCLLEPRWPEVACAELRRAPSLAAVCGHVEEHETDATLYNKLSPLRWRLPVGDIAACGGIFMIRAAHYLGVGGFDASLLTREEWALFYRLQTAGHRVVRLDVPMARHDSDLRTFGAWWQRAVWGGYGDAHGLRAEPDPAARASRLRWYLTWPFGLPLFGVLSTVASCWYRPALLGLATVFLSYGASFLRTARARLRAGDTLKDALTFGAFAIIRIFGCGLGFLRFHLSSSARRSAPDPHAPS